MCWLIAEGLWHRDRHTASVIWFLSGFYELSFYVGLGVGWIIWS